MIEVNLYSIPTNDMTSKVGKCVARSRFDRESMGVSVEEFVKGFLKDNLEKFEAGLGVGNELTELINSDTVLSRKDLSCINYLLVQSGFMFNIQNVTDDEENATGVPSGDVVEWNVIDHNFVQNDYPTATKILPAPGTDIPTILKTVIDQSGLFNDAKFAGIKNPFNELLTNLDRIKNVSGSVNSTLVSKIYEYLDVMGLEVFCATSED